MSLSTALNDVCSIGFVDHHVKGPDQYIRSRPSTAKWDLQRPSAMNSGILPGYLIFGPSSPTGRPQDTVQATRRVTLMLPNFARSTG